MNFYVEMSLKMVENFNKQIEQVQFSCIWGYFCVTCVPTSRACNDYTIKTQEYIIQNKFVYFDDFICWNEKTNNKKTQVNWNIFLVLLCLFFNTICVITARECKDYNTNLRNILFQKNSVYFGNFICWNETTNATKLE
jgi:hypothetical protein